MPTSIPDLAWYVSTGFIVILMSAIAALLGWGFSLLVKKLDNLTTKLDVWVTETAKLKTKMEDHIRHNEQEHAILFEKIRDK